MKKRELKKRLEPYDKDALISLIADMYDKKKLEREYLEYFFAPNEVVALKNYKKEIYYAFFPGTGYMYSLSNGKKAISDFRKLSPSVESVIDLMLYYVECGVKLTTDYGDMNEPFYLSLESVYERVLKMITKHAFQERYKKRAYDILRRTKFMGWGFYDTLGHSFFEVYDQDEFLKDS